MKQDRFEESWADDLGFVILLLLIGLVVFCFLIGITIYILGG